MTMKRAERTGSDFIGAEGFPVGEYIHDELESRGWTTRDCALRMGGDPAVDELTLDLHIAVMNAPAEHAIHDCRLSEETAVGLELALGISSQTWMNLDRSYHRWREAAGGRKA